MQELYQESEQAHESLLSRQRELEVQVRLLTEERRRVPGDALDGTDAAEVRQSIYGIRKQVKRLSRNCHKLRYYLIEAAKI